VEYCKSFNPLLGRDICPLYACLLISLYTHQKLKELIGTVYAVNYLV
jgi:hypothetical protein